LLVFRRQAAAGDDPIEFSKTPSPGAQWKEIGVRNELKHGQCRETRRASAEQPSLREMDAPFAGKMRDRESAPPAMPLNAL